MIKDNIKNKDTYLGILPDMDRALKYMGEIKEKDFAVGKIELDGENLFHMNQTYTTEIFSDHKFESHKKYIDIQYILFGSENIRISDIGDLDLCDEYNPEKDIMLYKAAYGMDVKLRAGDFVILFPQDGHIPKVACGHPEEVKKVVFKIKIS